MWPSLPLRLLLLASSLLSLFVGTVSTTSIYVNCGGPLLYQDNAGNVWIGDKYYTNYFSTTTTSSGSKSYSTTQNIRGTKNPTLYQTERWVSGEMTYTIPVASNGTFHVRMHFAEIFPNAQAPDARKFNVFLEGNLVMEEYDIFAETGGYTASIESFTTTVKDGVVTIRFVSGSIQNPKVSAIEIHSAAPSSIIMSPTAAPNVPPSVSPMPASNPFLVPSTVAPPTSSAIRPSVPTPIPRGSRLRTLVECIPGRNFSIGYASSTGFLNFSDDYTAVAAAEFNIMTPENDMKFGLVQPKFGVFDFGPADEHVKFAAAHGMQVHGHALIWHSQNPAFVDNNNWARNELCNIMAQHIWTVVRHYRGAVAIWDVVNEPLNYDGSFESTVWCDTIGPDYIAMAFQMAHAADPSATLILNDYGVLDMNPKSNATYQLVKDLQNSGTPIHGVGFQAHLSTEDTINYKSVAKNMQRFADLGLEIFITEMDVRIPDNATSDNVLLVQASIYKNIVSTCLEQPACRALQFWGFTDKDTWIPSHYPNYGRPLLFDDNFEAKPAYYAVQSALVQYLQTIASGRQQQTHNVTSGVSFRFTEFWIVCMISLAWIA